MKILIVCPSFDILGGVANHYKGLAPFWKSDIFYVFQGKRKNIPAAISFIPDFIKYIYLLLVKSPDVVIVNPSLRRYQLFRDSIYVIIAKLFPVKVITFIHGWDDLVAQKIIAKPYYFLNSFGRSSCFFVLYSKFREKLIEMGVKVPILLTTTKVSDELIGNFNIEMRDGSIRQILFLARIEISKGILVVLKIFSLLKLKYPYLKLSICGIGSALQDAKDYVVNNRIDDVFFHGNVSGKLLIQQFRQSDLYILPTAHGEGMATSILEAMAFGLPIISRPVGGICDFFLEGRMGFLLNTLEPQYYVDIIDNLISNPTLVKQISLFNHEYAEKHFLASEVTKILESNIYDNCMH